MAASPPPVGFCQGRRLHHPCRRHPASSGRTFPESRGSCRWMLRRRGGFSLAERVLAGVLAPGTGSEGRLPVASIGANATETTVARIPGQSIQPLRSYQLINPARKLPIFITEKQGKANYYARNKYKNTAVDTQSLPQPKLPEGSIFAKAGRAARHASSNPSQAPSMRRRAGLSLPS